MNFGAAFRPLFTRAKQQMPVNEHGHNTFGKDLPGSEQARGPLLCFLPTLGGFLPACLSRLPPVQFQYA